MCTIDEDGIDFEDWDITDQNSGAGRLLYGDESLFGENGMWNNFSRGMGEAGRDLSGQTAEDNEKKQKSKDKADRQASSKANFNTEINRRRDVDISASVEAGRRAAAARRTRSNFFGRDNLEQDFLGL